MSKTIDAMKLALEASLNHAGNYKLTDAEHDVQESAQAALSEAIAAEEAQTVEHVAQYLRNPDRNAVIAQLRCGGTPLGNEAADMLAADAQRYDELFAEYHEVSAEIAMVKREVEEVKSLRVLLNYEYSKPTQQVALPNNINDKQYSRDVVTGLYELLATLPPCNLLGLVGDAIQQIQAQQVAVPQGYALVPIEPTNEMVQACDAKFVPRIALPFFVAAYKTMLAAAPQPPQAAPRVPMTDGQIEDLGEKLLEVGAHGCVFNSVAFARAIEAHHKIGVKP